MAEDESTREKLIRSLDEIMFAASGIERAIDEAALRELDEQDRRRFKADALSIFDTADRMMTRVTQMRTGEPVEH